MAGWFPDFMYRRGVAHKEKCGLGFGKRKSVNPTRRHLWEADFIELVLLDFSVKRLR